MRTPAEKLLNKAQRQNAHREVVIASANLESEIHLPFDEDLDVVLPPLLDRLEDLKGASA